MLLSIFIFITRKVENSLQNKGFTSFIAISRKPRIADVNFEKGYCLISAEFFPYDVNLCYLWIFNFTPDVKLEFSRGYETEDHISAFGRIFYYLSFAINNGCNLSYMLYKYASIRTTQFSLIHNLAKRHFFNASLRHKASLCQKSVTSQKKASLSQRSVKNIIELAHIK